MRSSFNSKKPSGGSSSSSSSKRKKKTKDEIHGEATLHGIKPIGSTNKKKRKAVSNDDHTKSKKTRTSQCEDNATIRGATPSSACHPVSPSSSDLDSPKEATGRLKDDMVYDDTTSSDATDSDDSGIPNDVNSHLFLQSRLQPRPRLNSKKPSNTLMRKWKTLKRRSAYMRRMRRRTCENWELLPLQRQSTLASPFLAHQRDC